VLVVVGEELQKKEAIGIVVFVWIKSIRNLQIEEIEEM
jgi:hypothetical protein